MPLLKIRFCAFICLSGVVGTSASADDWPQYRGARRDGVWRETGIMESFAGPQMPIKWRVPVSNGYTSPTVADGRVYLMDRVSEPAEQERVLCFDWKTGKSLWTYAYNRAYGNFAYADGPRASVTVHDGRAYTLGAMGDLHCFDAATGKVLWKHDCLTEHKIRIPDFGVSAHPLIEGDNVIVHIGGENACLVAFDRKSGREVWRALDDPAGYATPAVITQAGKRVLIVWTGTRIVGLNPASGQVYWDYDHPPAQTKDSIVTPEVYRDLVFVSCWFDGALLLRLKPDASGVVKVWHRRGPNERNTEALHQLMATPLFIDEHIYGIDTYGELRCLDLKTGDRVWESQAVTPKGRNSTAHFIRNGDRWFAFNERGDLIICKLSPKGYEEISRTHLIKPTRGQFNERGGVVWSHPAFAYKHVFARNDEELVCASLEAK